MKLNYSRALHIVCILGVLSVMLLSPLDSSFALTGPQVTQYEPLAPLNTGSGKVTSGTYIPNLFRLGIGIAAGLAVLAIAYNGLKYMLSDVVTNKSEAKAGIGKALLGLLLALSCFLILRTINPALTDLDFGNTVPTLPTDINIEPPPPAGGATVRLEFYGGSVGIKIQKYVWQLSGIYKDGSTFRVPYTTKQKCTDAQGNLDPVALKPDTGTSCTRVPYSSECPLEVPLLNTSCPAADPVSFSGYDTVVQCEGYFTPQNIPAFIQPYEEYTVVVPCSNVDLPSIQTKLFNSLIECTNFTNTIDKSKIVTDCTASNYTSTLSCENNSWCSKGMYCTQSSGGTCEILPSSTCKDDTACSSGTFCTVSGNSVGYGECVEF